MPTPPPPPSLSDDFNEHIFCLNSSINFTVETERERGSEGEKRKIRERTKDKY